MGRFHKHADGTVHEHDHPHRSEHDLGDHSGYGTGRERVQVLERIFGENDRTAAANRADFERTGVRAVNVMSSPGAGKTTLLAETLRRLGGSLRLGVIEGDIETSLDADRLTGLGAQITLVNTGDGFGGECHLDAPMVRSALPRLRLAELDLVLIENVGNLVCPAEFDVGEHARAMIFSITEGEEKPLKYPVMFRSADVCGDQQDRPAPPSGLRPGPVPSQSAAGEPGRADAGRQRAHRRRGGRLVRLADRPARPLSGPRRYHDRAGDQARHADKSCQFLLPV